MQVLTLDRDQGNGKGAIWHSPAAVVLIADRSEGDPRGDDRVAAERRCEGHLGRLALLLLDHAREIGEGELDRGPCGRGEAMGPGASLLKIDLPGFPPESVDLSLEITLPPANVEFLLIPLPNQLTLAEHNAQREIGQRITELLSVDEESELATPPVFFGTP